jgi:hypothetical protein
MYLRFGLIGLIASASFALLVAGCARDVVVRMPAATLEQPSTKLATVTVLDARRPGVAASTREAMGTPLGNITFEPSEAEILKRDLEAELSRRMAAKGLTRNESFSAVLEEFGVNTESTPVYWDVNARIAVVLKHGTREFPLSGTGTERTYVWPGDEEIRRALNLAMQQVNSGLGPVVDSLQ